MRKLYISDSNFETLMRSGEVEVTFCEGASFSREMEEFRRKGGVIILISTTSECCTFVKAVDTHEIIKDAADSVNGYFITVKFRLLTIA